ncbi:DsbA family protein [Candidatus Pelagibacter sp.]|nr:DsbA family protein [Candidatus Pelagibacter sp.]
MKKIFTTVFIIFFYFLPKNVQSEIKPIIEGNVDAKVKLIVFESLTCSHCANFHKNIYPSLKEEFINKGHVSIEFKNFPLDMAALNGSKIAHCKNNGKSEILHYLFENQSQWVKGNTIADLNENLKNLMDKSEFKLNFDQCLNNKEIEEFILEDRISGTKKYKIEATPTLIINGKKFENASNYKKLKKYLEKLI